MIPPLPAPLSAYAMGATLLSPLAPAWLRYRAARGKEVTARLPERRGRPGRDRPDGDLVWAHGASIGETLSLLPVVEALVARGLKVLVTSGTVTSAEILERRLPPGARHQFMPLDAPRFVGRFLDHWRPCLALFAESEIWPNTILQLERRRIPLIMINGRLSERSAARWARMPEVARALVSRFALCIAQSTADAGRLADLGAPLAEVSGNLKFDLPPPPADPAAVEQLATELAGRAAWLAASTHPGEDAAIFEAHRAIRARHPDALTLIAPRHPARGGEIAEAAHAAGLSAIRRSKRARLAEAGDLYVADTVGELGLFLRLAPLVFMGGSLVPHGGQNPFEPARLGLAILHGPHVANFAEIFGALDAAGGSLPVTDAAALALVAADLIGDAARLRDIGRTALETALSLGGALDRTMRAIAPYLPPPRPSGDAFW